jgi:hypothetical protein
VSLPSKSLIAAVCVVGAAAVAWRSLQRTPPPDHSLEEQAVQSVVDVPRARSSVDSEPPAPLESERPIAAVAAQSTERESASSDQEGIRGPAELLAERRAEADAAVAEAYALATSFAVESRDRTWAETTEAELSNRIAQTAGLELTTLRIECRETVCRIDFTFPSRAYMETSGGDLAITALSGTRTYETGDLILVGDNGTLTYYVQLRESAD